VINHARIVYSLKQGVKRAGHDIADHAYPFKEGIVSDALTAAGRI
jgi:hypothetical protein